VLQKLSPQELYVEVHPDDAAALGLRDGEAALVSTRRGKVRARAFVTAIVQAGQIFMPMHFAETRTRASRRTNRARPSWSAAS